MTENSEIQDKEPLHNLGYQILEYVINHPLPFKAGGIAGMIHGALTQNWEEFAIGVAAYGAGEFGSYGKSVRMEHRISELEKEINKE